MTNRLLLNQEMSCLFPSPGRFHLQPQGLPSVLQQGQARVGRATQDVADGVPGDVRMVPPEEVERGDLIQEAIALDLLTIDEDRRQDFQVVPGTTDYVGFLACFCCAESYGRISRGSDEKRSD